VGEISYMKGDVDVMPVYGTFVHNISRLLLTAVIAKMTSCIRHASECTHSLTH